MFDNAKVVFAALLGAVLMMPGNGLAAGEAMKPAPPNILLILADDLGYSDLGCYGGEIKTPNLDALAAHGLRLTQFYNCSRCCPSRILADGAIPASGRHRRNDGGRGTPRLSRLASAALRDHRPGAKTAGYRTAMAGKWHVGDQQPPTVRGFDDFYGFVRGYAVDSWEPRMMTRLPADRPQPSYELGKYFATDALTDTRWTFSRTFAVRRRAPGRRPGFFTWRFRRRISLCSRGLTTCKAMPKFTAQGWDEIRRQAAGAAERACSAAGKRAAHAAKHDSRPERRPPAGFAH